MHDLSNYVTQGNKTIVPWSIIDVEHRTNNPKRDFLFVNRNQGKHIPQSPGVILGLFRKLLEHINIGQSKILVIGFAETATALGNYIADHLANCKYYLQTTREDIDEYSNLIEFSEEHSHATQQKIYSISDIAKMDFDYVLFVDDEITTGNTIRNGIKALRTLVNPNVRFGVASICNWQGDTDFSDIDRFYLIGATLKDVNTKMAGAVYKLPHKPSHLPIEINVYTVSLPIPNARKGYKPCSLYKCISTITNNLKIKDEHVLVLGTEEYMYIPLLVAERLESAGCDVVTHATTRSSIDATEYPNGIHSKTILPSAYDSKRETYIYNLQKYDKVCVITDATDYKAFAYALTHRLTELGVKPNDIYFIQIKENNNEV